MSRDLDIVLWGATGFVGQLTAEYFARRYADSGIRWGLAGRSHDKLTRLRDDLTARFGLSELPVVVADARDRASLDAMAAQSRVVCTTVGPYALYGSELVAACVAQKTHYCDLTGEVAWVREMIEAHHDAAAESGTRIVHCCGFDSIPSDLGAYMLQRYARAEFGSPCGAIRLYVEKAKGGVSGGTAASMATALEQARRDPKARRALWHPYALNPVGEQAGPDGSPQFGPRYDDAVKRWTGPFFMAPVNEKVVRRTNALLGYPYGQSFSYHEVSQMGRGIGGVLRAGSMSAAMAGFESVMRFGPGRRAIKRWVLPKPGEGPSRETIEQGYFVDRLLGWGRSESGEPFTLEGHVTADSDPGYGATSIMLAESALCLAREEVDSPLSGGVLTPAAALGMTLVERLRQAGMGFDVRRV